MEIDLVKNNLVNYNYNPYIPALEFEYFPTSINKALFLWKLI